MLKSYQLTHFLTFLIRFVCFESDELEDEEEEDEDDDEDSRRDFPFPFSFFFSNFFLGFSSIVVPLNSSSCFFFNRSCSSNCRLCEIY